MSRTIVVWIVLLGAAALGGVWFFSNYERVNEKQWVGYSGEARHNQYLAAERLLARMGVAARHVKTIPELKELPVNGSLLLPDRREALTPDARLAAPILRSLGLGEGVLPRVPLLSRIGNTGVASPLLALAACLEEAEPGVAAVAVAVRAHATGRAVGTTSIAGPMQRVTPERFEAFHRMLRRAADRLGMIWPRTEGITEESTAWTASASTA